MHVHIIDEEEFYDDELDYIDLKPLPYLVFPRLCDCLDEDCNVCTNQ